MTSSTDDLKALVVAAVDSTKNLLAYLDKNPGKLTALKTELKEKLGSTIVSKLVRLMF